MVRSASPGRSGLLPGTLELVILKSLSVQSMHGYGIAQHLQRLSGDVLQVEEGSLYPALQRLQVKGLVKSAWRRSATGRRARYYDLTAAGQRQLAAEATGFDRLVTAIRAVLGNT